MGTETLAPLLYYFLRFTRPRTVLELGAGYTTPFIARALLDNRRDFPRDRAALVDKIHKFDAQGSTPQDAAAWNAFYEQAPVAVPAPAYYAGDYASAFTVVDDFSTAESSSSRVRKALEAQGLAEHVSFVPSTLDSFAAALQTTDTYDLVWCDLWGSLQAFENFFPRLRSGGMMAFHWLLSERNGEALLRLFKSRAATSGYEIISFREPHKSKQNSVTLLRRTDEGSRRTYEDLQKLLNEARLLS
jgi:hypothetical protein